MRIISISLAASLTAFSWGGAAAQDWNGTTPLAQARYSGCAVRLNDGRVLVTGGLGTDAAPLASSEIYMPDGTFVPAAAMIAARARHSCVTLADGRALIVGGDPGGTAELYDPQGDAWVAVNGTGEARAGATATLLRDRRVIIAGGSAPDGTVLTSMEIFSPEDNTLTALEAKLSTGRDRFGAVLLVDGSVLFIGGMNGDGVLNTTDRFRPVDNRCAPGPLFNVGRSGHSVTPLLDGRVLVAGGWDGAVELDTAEVYDPASDTFRLLDARLSVARRDHLAILVSGNGGVLLAGGTQGDQALSATEIFQPVDNSFTRLGDLTLARSSMAGAMVADGLILAVGGVNADGAQTACGLLLLPSIQLTKSVYRPGDQVQVSGSSFRPNTKITFTLELISGTAITLSNSRLLTPSVTTPQPANFQLQVGFSAVPVMATTGNDAGKSVLVVAQAADGTTVQASAVVKVATSITLNQPVGLYEGFNGTFVAQLNQATGLAAPLTGLFTLSTTSTSSCIADGTSNTIVLAESAGPNVTSANLSLNTSTAFLSRPVSNLAATPLRVAASYAGDAAHDPTSTSGCFQAVSRSTTLRLSAPASNLLQVGTPFNLTATVNSLPGTPSTNLTGTVNFFLDSFSLGAGQNSGSAVTTALTSSRQFTPLSVGPVSFTAQYSGDAFFKNSSSSAPLALTIQKANTQMSLVLPSATFHCDGPLTGNVQLNFPTAVGLANHTATIQSLFDDGSVRVVGGSNVSLTVTSPGVATGTMTIPSLPANALSVSATFGGDALLAVSQSASTRLTLATSPIAVVVVSPATAQPNPVTFNVTLTPQGCSATPTGNLEILDNGVPVTVVAVQGTLNGNAISVPVTISRPSGSHSIQARYSGDRIYQPTSSAAAILTVQ